MHRTQDFVKRIHSLLDDVEAVDDVHLVAKDLFDGGPERLGHIQHHHFNARAFGWRATLEPGDDLGRTPPFKRCNRLAFLQVDDQRVVVVPLASGVFVNANGSTELAGATAMAPFKCPAKHGAFGEAVALGECSARATSQVFLSHSGVKPLGPLDLLAEGRTRFPGPMPAIGALEASYMQP